MEDEKYIEIWNREKEHYKITIREYIEFVLNHTREELIMESSSGYSTMDMITAEREGFILPNEDDDTKKQKVTEYRARKFLAAKDMYESMTEEEIKAHIDAKVAEHFTEEYYQIWLRQAKIEEATQKDAALNEDIATVRYMTENERNKRTGILGQIKALIKLSKNHDIMYANQKYQSEPLADNASTLRGLFGVTLGATAMANIIGVTYGGLEALAKNFPASIFCFSFLAAISTTLCSIPSVTKWIKQSMDYPAAVESLKKAGIYEYVMEECNKMYPEETAGRAK